MESCQCDQGPNDKKTKACELCCKLPGEGQECKSSFELNVPPYDVPDMFSKPGTPCKNYKGYCDVFQKCREVSLKKKASSTFRNYNIIFYLPLQRFIHQILNFVG